VRRKDSARSNEGRAAHGGPAGAHFPFATLRYHNTRARDGDRLGYIDLVVRVPLDRNTLRILPAVAKMEQRGRPISAHLIPDGESAQLELGSRTNAKSRLRLVLPYPPAALSVNTRVSGADRDAATASYRQECHDKARAQTMNERRSGAFRLPLTSPVEADVIFFTRERRRRDKTNLLAMLRHGLAGLVDAGVLENDLVAFAAVDIAEAMDGREQHVEVRLR
jgi:hypothetical protein